ncbi:MAG: tRNA (N6-threonylcarbamoyladenosine(37)-N6)-methyltransferase TrmO [Candidatus Thorarchaeota archaeon]|nr:MAG: tRNA (N6-threonylcarbamoyladenosine(37)-N6)-methyltransferase TrmO [Candidatus Thorarchaeota archaeon]
MEAVVKSIGVIRSPFKSGHDVPIQAVMSDVIGEAVVFPEYSEGLESLDGFSHVILLYWCHRARPVRMLVKPYLDEHEHGLFSTRAPSRPNPIGLSTVRLMSLNGNRLVFRGADMIDGSPLLDIKPFVPEFDNRLDATSGWLAERVTGKPKLADNRFHQ